MKLGPDRLRQVLRRIFIRGGLTRRRPDGRPEACDQIAPRRLVAALTGDDQAQVISMKGIYKIIDGLLRGRGVVRQQVLSESRAHALQQSSSGERARIGRTRDQSRRAL